MSDLLTLRGFVATTPRHLVTSEGLPITSFRLASHQRRFDRTHDKWVDGDTNWYTVTSFRALAINTAGSIAKGDRVIVAGRIRIREWENGERTGTTIDVEADTVGHDLLWGTASFTRTIRATTPDASTDIQPDSREETQASDSGAESDRRSDLVSSGVETPF
ncbi:MAG: single-stranded DNA-binding protein [Microbacteriaceae bacterium]